MQRHQVTLGGLEQHLRAVIEREPHELGHHITPQGPAPGPSGKTVTHILPHPRPIHDSTPVTGAATKRGRTPRSPGWSIPEPTGVGQSAAVITVRYPVYCHRLWAPRKRS